MKGELLLLSLILLVILLREYIGARYTAREIWEAERKARELVEQAKELIKEAAELYRKAKEAVEEK